ncbi:hypothetical protein CHS0354_010976 [Potamilus streckersoni]|uniref:Uncharacterized protein n=1 Tax=Potamilus streckersoni TaxID=2493646 RepID=A0AAE0RQR8_9BIVA|nr:hypothetical protein CHS0354_010976 [Potamilus streckersoni]
MENFTSYTLRIQAYFEENGVRRAHRSKLILRRMLFMGTRPKIVMKRMVSIVPQTEAYFEENGVHGSPDKS